jgi:hypothetical protein
MGLESKLLALGVAGFAGLGARLIGRKGSNELGLLTAAFSISAIVLAQYCVAGHLSAELRTHRAGQDYAALVSDVKIVLRSIPNGTDQEIRAHLALQKWMDEEGNRVTPESISEEEVREFRDDTLPMFRRLADGSRSEDEWKASMGIQDGAVDDTENAEEIEFTTKGIFVLMAFSRFNLVCLIAAAGLAYKLTDV